MCRSDRSNVPSHASLVLMIPLRSMDSFSRTHTHTHPFNGPLSGTTRVSQYQKGKTNLDFTEARDSEWQWHQLGRMQVCTSLQTHVRECARRFRFSDMCASSWITNFLQHLSRNESGLFQQETKLLEPRTGKYMTWKTHSKTNNIYRTPRSELKRR